MSEREPPEQSSPESPAGGVSLVRALKIALVLFGLILVAVALATMVTDGSPHVPFDYGGGVE